MGGGGGRVRWWSEPLPVLRLRDRTLELGPRPLLMGIVNATPDSFSDGGARTSLDARLEHARRCWTRGPTCSTSAVSRRTRPPAGRRRHEELARVVPLVARLAGELGALGLGRHVQAGVGGGRDRRRRRDRERRLRAARPGGGRSSAPRTGAALVLMHTRVAPKGTLLDPGRYDDVVADVAGFLRERLAAALAHGVATEQLLLDPGPDFAQDPAQTRRGAAPLDELHALGRPLLLARLPQGLRRRAHRPGPRERLRGHAGGARPRPRCRRAGAARARRRRGR